jgi:hypothetical protein
MELISETRTTRQNMTNVSPARRSSLTFVTDLSWIFPFLIGRLILPFVARQAVLAVPVEKIVVVKETQVLNANRIFAPLALHCAAAKA